MSTKGWVRLGIGLLGVLFIVLTVTRSPDAAWSLLPVAFVLLVLIFALPSRKLRWGPKSSRKQRAIYTGVFVAAAILAMFLPPLVSGDGLSWSLLPVTAIAAAVFGAISWFTFQPQGQDLEGDQRGAR